MSESHLILNLFLLVNGIKNVLEALLEWRLAGILEFLDKGLSILLDLRTLALLNLYRVRNVIDQ